MSKHDCTTSSGLGTGRPGLSLVHVCRSLRAIISTTGNGSWRVPVRPLLQISSGNVSSLVNMLPYENPALMSSGDAQHCGSRQQAGCSKV